MNVGELTAKLTLNTAEFDSAAKGIGESVGDLAKGVGSAIGGVSAAVGAGVAAAAAGITALVKQSVESFADYEQLVGGVETLFKESAGIVEDYAVQAYKTAGISANEYMETVTSFSASLIQSLGGDTEKAADYANRAITDMADNANKMGTSMESIQNAYQGFAKGQYQLLDNLKIGYGGTQAEMQRLIADASKMTDVQRELGVTVDATSMSFSNVVNAISVMQASLGIAGATAKEAEGTISGSLKMLEASWKDLLTSIAGGGIGLNEAINNLVHSFEVFLGNVTPVIEEALYGIGDLIRNLVPVLGNEITNIITNLAPTLIDAAISLISELVNALPNILNTVLGTITALLPNITGIITGLLDTLMVSIIPMLVQFAANIIVEIGNAIVVSAPTMSSSLFQMIVTIVNILIEALPQIIQVGVSIVSALAQGIFDNSSVIVASIIQLVGVILSSIVEALPQLLLAGIVIIQGLAEGILQNISLITDTVVQIIVILIATIIQHIPEILAAAAKIGLAFVEGTLLAIPALTASVGRMLGIIKESETQVNTASNSMITATGSAGSTIGQTISGMSNNLSTAVSGMTTQYNSLVSNAGITSEHVTGTMKDMSDGVKKVTVPVYDQFGNLVRQFETTVSSSKASSATLTSTAQNTEKQLISANNNIIESNNKAMASMTKLNDMNANPRVDASGVVDGCNNIVSACNQAINALNRLGGATAGGSFAIGGARAEGGPVSGNTPYLVGEAGPELFVPNTRGYVIDAEETSKLFGGHGDVYITIEGDVYDDETSMRRKLSNVVLDVIGTELAYG